MFFSIKYKENEEKYNQIVWQYQRKMLLLQSS